MMNYEERKELRGNILNEIFEASFAVEEKARKEWQAENYLPSVEENKEACMKICKAAQEKAKIAFKGNDELYKRFFRECEEITNRFMKLNAKTPVEAMCGVSQVGYYLYDECFDLTAEALGIAVQRKEEWE